MKTYIRKSIIGNYIQFPNEINLKYWRGKIGTTYLDFLDGKWVLLSDEQATFHDLNPEASIEEVLNMLLIVPEPVIIPEKTQEELFLERKQAKIDLINEYDKSDNVNSFLLDGLSMWLDFDERSRLLVSINAYKKLNRENMTKIYNGDEFTFPIESWEEILSSIEVYASECLNTTELHKSKVQLAINDELLNAIDITKGYPERLTFGTGSYLNSSVNEGG